jgi:hypothetical protein
MKKITILSLIIIISTITLAQSVHEFNGDINVNNQQFNEGRINVKLNGDAWEHLLFSSDASNQYQILLSNGGGSTGQGWFGTLGSKTKDNTCALYMYGDNYGSQNPQRGLVVIDGRRNGGSASGNQNVLEIWSGWGNSLAQFMANGSLNLKNNISLKSVYLAGGSGIYSKYNNNYILNDHNNGNVTLSAAGGNLYLGYQNTGKLLLRKGLYDTSSTHRIIHENGYIDQTKAGVNNNFAGNLISKGRLGTGRQGVYGTYNSSQVQGIWAIGSSWKVNTTNNDFGNQYGIAYAHTNAGTSAIGGKKPIASNGHQILFTDNGKANVSISLSNGNIVTRGSIIATEIKVESTGGADFVFEPNYHLKDLTEVEAFIKTNKHLPDIPSAAEMEEAGVNLAEMNKLLLMKVEELTLYSIEQEK